MRKVVHIHKIDVGKRAKLEFTFYETAIGIIPAIQIGWGGEFKEIPYAFAFSLDWLMFGISIWFKRKGHVQD